MFDDLNEYFSLRNKKPIDFDTLKRFIDCILRRCSNSKLDYRWDNKKHVTQKNFMWDKYKQYLINKYSTNDLNNVPLL